MVGPRDQSKRLLGRLIRRRAGRAGGAAACVVVLVALAAAGSMRGVSASGGTDELFEHGQELGHPDGAPLDRFGQVAVIEGDTAVVGAGYDDARRGSAHVFVRSDGVWAHSQELVAPDRSAGEGFGASLAIEGDTLLVGGGGADGNGGVHVFTRSGGVWSHAQELRDPNAAPFDFFGVSVALSGDTIVVGAVGDDGTTGDRTGAAHVFTRRSGVWTHTVELAAPSPAAGDHFAESVAIEGDTVVVSLDRRFSARAGTLEVFTRSRGAWSHSQTLSAPAVRSGDNFGTAMAMDGDTIVAGAETSVAAAPRGGAAFVFTRSGDVWSFSQQLLDPDAEAGDLFGNTGYGVALDGSMMVIGSMGDFRGSKPGTAHVFVRGSDGAWTHAQELNDPNGRRGDWFGRAVAIDANAIIIGAPLDSAAGADAGAAHVFAQFVPPAPRFLFTNVVRTSIAEHEDSFGVAGDDVFTADVDGDGVTEIVTRAAGTRVFTVFEPEFTPFVPGTGAIEVGQFSYGEPGDDVRFGDFDGSGTETPAVRRGNLIVGRNAPGSGSAQFTISFGKTTDADWFVGDWDNDGIDTFAIRRGNVILGRNSLTSGKAQFAIGYGRAGDEYHAGRWSPGAGDTFTVRRGKTLLVRFTLTTGPADLIYSYGKAGDTYFRGDWNSDGVDTFAVQR